MKLILNYAIILFSILSALPRAYGEVGNNLVGSWSLVQLEQPAKDGTIKKITDAKGSFIFSADGHVSVQVMYANSESDHVEYAKSGYEATFGTYKIDATKRTFTVHVDGALVRSLIGKDLDRSFEISNDRMVVRSTRPDEKWSVIWKRN